MSGLKRSVEGSWSPYLVIEDNSYAFLESIGTNISVYKSERFKTYKHVVLPVDWPMGLLFRVSSGWKVGLLNDVAAHDEEIVAYVREPKRLSIVGRIRLKKVQETWSVTESTGILQNYYLVDPLPSKHRSLVERLVNKTLERRPRLIYAVKTFTTPNVLKVLRGTIRPGPFELAVLCHEGEPLTLYKSIVKALKGMVDVLCIEK